MDSYIEGNWKDELTVVRIHKAGTGEEVELALPLEPGDYDIYYCTLEEGDCNPIEEHGFKQDHDVLDTGLLPGFGPSPPWVGLIKI